MKVSDRDVMRLFDGELDGHVTRRVLDERLRDPSVDARLAGLLQVAAFTRTWARASGVASPSRAARRVERSLPLRLALCSAALALGVLCVVPLLASRREGVAGEPVPRGLPAAAVAVEQVDFGTHPGTIFSVSAAGTETTVVWLSDEADGTSLTL